MYKRYAAIRDSKGYTDSAVSKATGIPKSSLTDWKSGRNSLKVERLEAIAQFLGVSVVDFFEDVSSFKIDDIYSKEEKDLIDAFRAASDDNKRSVRLILGLKK